MPMMIYDYQRTGHEYWEMGQFPCCANRPEVIQYFNIGSAHHPVKLLKACVASVGSAVI